MKAPDLKKWNFKPEFEGLLFFAQALIELLFDYTTDTYKIPALNARMLVHELFASIEDIETNILRQGTIEPIVNELVDALKKDPVIKAILSSYFKEFVESINHKQNVTELKIKVTFLKNKLETVYFDTAKELIRESIIQYHEKEQIVRLAKVFINELISKGYSRQSIYFETERFFFTGRAPLKIENTAVINDYLDMFNFEERQYSVLYRVEKNYNFAKEYAGEFAIEIVDICPSLEFVGKSEKVDGFLTGNRELPLFLIVKQIQAFDDFRARSLADEHLLLFDSLATYHVHRVGLRKSQDVLVYTEDQKKWGICKKPNPAVLMRPDRPSETLSTHAKRTVKNIISEKLEVESFLRLKRAFFRHNAAVKSEAPETQLLEFWSAIEVLFPPIESGTDRIVQICDSLVPFVCSEYAAKLLADLYLSLRNSGLSSALEILEKISEGTSHIEKCIALIALEENESFRKEYYNLFERHPLLKNRLYVLREKFASADTILDTLTAHIQRVSWQIRRIYRTRNLIIHSGKTVPYVNILVENVHAYVDRVLDLLNERIFYASHSTSIDQIALEVKLEIDSHLRKLRELGKTRCVLDNYKLILFGNV